MSIREILRHYRYTRYGNKIARYIKKNHKILWKSLKGNNAEVNVNNISLTIFRKDTEYANYMACQLQLNAMLKKQQNVRDGMPGRTALFTAYSDWIYEEGFGFGVDGTRRDTEDVFARQVIIKQYIKENIVSPVYRLCHKISPQMADCIKGRIYERKARRKLVFDDNGGKARILVDSTYFSVSNDRGGIYRLCSNVSRELFGLEHELSFVKIANKQLWTNYAHKLYKKDSYASNDKIIKFNQGDVLFLLEPSWGHTEDLQVIIDEMHKAGGRVFAIVHDLLPLYYPEFFSDLMGVEVFRRYHELMMKKCDGIICDSQATADCLIDYVSKNELVLEGKTEVSFFHCGIFETKTGGSVRGQLKEYLSAGKPVFLMVGTVEPRKGHGFVLKTFRELWKAGDASRLLIIGHDGWQNKAFKELFQRVQQEFPANILWLSDASDAELIYSYKNATCYLAASRDEGFGLPLVEAARHDLPILCSDIPVFHEVSQGYADYFPVFDTKGLKEALKKWQQTAVHPESSKIKTYTWHESAQEILAILKGESAAYKILE